jgi:hypothetical protein
MVVFEVVENCSRVLLQNLGLNSISIVNVSKPLKNLSLTMISLLVCQKWLVKVGLPSHDPLKCFVKQGLQSCWKPFL